MLLQLRFVNLKIYDFARCRRNSWGCGRKVPEKIREAASHRQVVERVGQTWVMGETERERDREKERKRARGRVVSEWADVSIVWHSYPTWCRDLWPQTDRPSCQARIFTCLPYRLLPHPTPALPTLMRLLNFPRLVSDRSQGADDWGWGDRREKGLWVRRDRGSNKRDKRFGLSEVELNALEHE